MNTYEADFEERNNLEVKKANNMETLITQMLEKAMFQCLQSAQEDKWMVVI